MTYTATLRQNNAMLETMQATMDKLTDTLDNFAKSQKTFTEQTKKAKKAEQALNKELVTREETLNKAFEKLKEGGLEVRKFEIFSKKSFDAFIDAGGNAFDFFDLALSSANQRVKIFGVEASLARKVMYGFLPPGMFRLVNKLSTSFRFLGGIFRKTGEDGENIDNIFKKMTRGLLSLPKIMKMKKGDFNIMDKLKSGFSEAKRISNISKGFSVGIGEEKQKIRDAGRQMAQGKITQDEFLKIREAAKEQIKLLEEARDMSIERSKLGKFTNKFIEGLKAAPRFLSQALLFFGKILLYAGIFLTIAYILWKTIGKTIIEALQEAWPAIKEAATFMLGGIMTVFEGVKKIFHGFFGDGGSLMDVIDGVIIIGFGILQFALGAVGVLLVTLGGLVVEFISVGFDKLVSFVGDMFENSEKFLKALPALLLIIGGVIAFVMGAPIWIAATIGIVLYQVAAWTIKKFKGIIPGFASGGVSSGGLAVVGERGAELVNLPRGSRVHSNSESKAMISNSRPVNNFNITINAKDTSDAELRRIADKIGKMTSSRINRNLNSSVMR